MKKLIAALVFGACAFAAMSLFADYGYYDDGHLLAHWDAIDNQGTGAHVDGAETWVDLKTGGEFVLNEAAWGDRFLQFAGANTSYAKLTDETVLGFLDFADETVRRTVEITYQQDKAQAEGLLFIGPSSSQVGIGLWTKSTFYILGEKTGTSTMPAPADTAFHTVTVGYCNKLPATDENARYRDGSPVELSGKNYWGNADTAMYLGRGKSLYPIAAKIYSVRIYDCLLTPEQAEQNRVTDLDLFQPLKLGRVTQGSVSFRGRTFSAGQDITGHIGETGLSLDSATEASVVLEDFVTSLSIGTGALSLESDTMAGLADLTLGANTDFMLPAHGLSVSGAITADSTATVHGPGLLIGTAAESPVALADGAVYVSSQGEWTGWPDSGVAYVPADTVADITAGDVAKIANLDGIVLLGVTSRVTYSLPDAFALAVPVSGSGTFAFESAGDVTISGDNRDLTGCFYFSNTTVLVAHEFGLGSYGSGTCHFWNGGDKDVAGEGHTIDFDDGKPVFTNRVAVYMHPNAAGVGSNGKAVEHGFSFGSISLDKTLVQDADFRYGRYTVENLSPTFKNNVRFLKLVAFQKASGSNKYPYWYGTANGSVYLLGTATVNDTGIWFVSTGNWHWGFTWTGGNVRYAHYSGAHVICERENVFASSAFSVQMYQNNSVLDLNGYDQDAGGLCTYSSTGHTSGDPIVQIVSDRPAAFRLTGNRTKTFTGYDINPRFGGAAGFTKAGDTTYSLCDESGTVKNDTTGELKVEAGVLNVTANYKWTGTNVTVTGGALAVFNSVGAIAGDKVHLVVSDGTFAVGPGCANSILVGSATFGATELPDGTYTMAELKAMPAVAPFIGAEADDAATLTVQKPSDFDWTGWPDEPSDVKVPGGTTVYVGADETNKVALALSIDLGVNAKIVFTNMPDAVIALAMPISGKGVFAFEDCGTVVITADNSNLLAPGAFSFTRTSVIVESRYGLGAAGAGACEISTENSESAPRRSLRFRGAATANDVAINLDHGLDFGYETAPEVEFVQNGAFTRTDGSTKNWGRLAIINRVTFAGETLLDVCDSASGTNTVFRFSETSSLRSRNNVLYFYGSVGSTFIFDTSLPSPRLGEVCFQNSAKVSLNAPYAFDLQANLSATPPYGGLQTWGGGTFDMKGNDQFVSRIFASGGKDSTPDPVVFTSDAPATLFMTNAYKAAAERAFAIRGAASLDYSGTQEQIMDCGDNDTTGSLVIHGGTLTAQFGSHWGGTDVRILGGALAIKAGDWQSMAEKKQPIWQAKSGVGVFFNRKTDLVMAAEGATLSIYEGHEETVRTLKVGDDYVRAGVYGGPESSAAKKLDCLAGKGLLRVRRNSPDEGILILVR